MLEKEKITNGVREDAVYSEVFANAKVKLLARLAVKFRLRLSEVYRSDRF